MSQISFQMSEFQSSVNSIENKFDLIYNSVKDTLHDLNNAKECLKQATQSHKNANIDEINLFRDKISDVVFQECDLMKNSLKELVDISNDFKHFQQKEMEARGKFNQNPDEFDEKILKNLINMKPNKQNSDHPKYLEIEEMIENAKNGVENNGEDLVMDTPQNQIIKCPITSKPIEVSIKNSTCDHSYEREAILAYVKSRPNRKCPYAGCKQLVVLPR